MKKVVFNGKFLYGDSSGVSRWGKEILQELDKIAEPGKYELLLWQKDTDKIKLQNIKKVEIKCKTDHQWRWKCISYLRRTKALYVHLSSGLAVNRDSIITLHDICVYYGVTGWTKMHCFKSKCRLFMTALMAGKIVTVSEYSKQTILDKLPVKPEKVEVIGCGWQHIINIQSDDGILERFGLKEKEYYFFIGRLVRNKNIQWIFEVADHNPDSIFVISGELRNEKFDFYKGKSGNILYTGFVSDSEMKSLYQHCKAFLFPSIMEGFGIPPMEALYNGAPIIVSNTSSLPEVYGKSAHYIDPYKYDYNLEEILEEQVESPEKVLSSYSWEKSARQWKELLERYAEKSE